MFIYPYIQLFLFLSPPFYIAHVHQFLSVCDWTKIHWLDERPKVIDLGSPNLVKGQMGQGQRSLGSRLNVMGHLARDINRLAHININYRLLHFSIICDDCLNFIKIQLSFML